MDEPAYSAAEVVVQASVRPAGVSSTRLVVERAPMHPLIARFLDVQRAATTLAGLPADELDRALIAAAAKDPQAKAAVLAANGKPQPGSASQEAVILLATDAATELVLVDEHLALPAKRATEALLREGASPTEARALIATAVLEEAFGYAEDPAVFDRSFLAESFGSLEVLATVTEDTVDGWLDAFSKKGAPAERPLRLGVAQALLEAAFADGPQPITPEHADDALDTLAETLASNELERAAKALVDFITFLGEQKVIGSERGRRLSALVTQAAAAGLGEGDDEEADDEDDDETE